MRTPPSLQALVDHGILDAVQRPLMSGKEAHIYLVEAGGQPCVAKIYKEAQNRSFQNRADYTEGRKVRNSRDQRAMSSRSKHGRAQNEAAWKSAEVDMIYRLRHAGVRVPAPLNYIDGVLIMELVTDADGYPAPRLGDLTLEPAQATEVFHRLLTEVIRMLCAGVVHGDLSDFNVLMDADGPVIIDFPQAVDASSNANARKLLLRDVDNLHRFHAKFVPGVQALPYAQEMWDLYSRNALTPDTRLTGKFRTRDQPVNTRAVLGLIADAERDERRRREALGLSMRGAAARDAPMRASQPTQAPQPAQAERRDDRRRDVRHVSRGQPAARASDAPQRDGRAAPSQSGRREGPTRSERPELESRQTLGQARAAHRQGAAQERAAPRDERETQGERAHAREGQPRSRAELPARKEPTSFGVRRPYRPAQARHADEPARHPDTQQGRSPERARSATSEARDDAQRSKRRREPE